MPLINLSPHFLDLLAPSVSISAGVHQIVCSIRLQAQQQKSTIIFLRGHYLRREFKEWTHFNMLLGESMLSMKNNVIYRMNKEGFEVFGLGTQLKRPWNLPFQDLVDRIHVVQVWSFSEKQLSPSSKQTLYWNATQLEK